MALSHCTSLTNVDVFMGANRGGEKGKGIKMKIEKKRKGKTKEKRR